MVNGVATVSREEEASKATRRGNNIERQAGSRSLREEETAEPALLERLEQQRKEAAEQVRDQQAVRDLDGHVGELPPLAREHDPRELLERVASIKVLNGHHVE